MKEHNWEIEEGNGGHVGTYEFWKCSVCGASGGPACLQNNNKPKMSPFIADGSGTQLPEDCDEAKKIIASHVFEPANIPEVKRFAIEQWVIQVIKNAMPYATIEADMPNTVKHSWYFDIRMGYAKLTVCIYDFIFSMYENVNQAFSTDNLAGFISALSDWHNKNITSLKSLPENWVPAK